MDPLLDCSIDRMVRLGEAAGINTDIELRRPPEAALSLNLSVSYF